MLKKILAATAIGAAALLSPAHAGEVDTDPMARTGFYVPIQIGTGFATNYSEEGYGYELDIEGRKLFDVTTGIGYDFGHVRAEYRIGYGQTTADANLSDGYYEYSVDDYQTGALVSALGVAFDIPTNSRVVPYVGVDLTGAYAAGEVAYGVVGKAGVSYLASDKVDVFVQGDYTHPIVSSTGFTGDKGAWGVSGGVRIRL